jgi:conjugative relaxase-like TrwC/TraI family protein
MLSIARLRPATAARGYYERAGRADAGWSEWTGIPASEWVGGAAVLVGVRGAIAPGSLTRLLLGTDPVSGRVLRPTAPPRTVTRTVRDPGTGARVPVTATARPVAGFDLVFSAPKSVSLLLVLDDPPVSAVTAAHRAAWQAALAFLEGHTCVVRRKGVGVNGAGYVGGAFAHYVNRDGDPHLHTHVVIANQSVAPADPARWRALDATPLLVSWRRAGGAVYEACLRRELTAHLGLRWRRAVHGGFEVAGIGDGDIRATSRRSAVVRAHAAAHGVTSAHGARIAGRVARPPRRGFDCDERRHAWTRLARDLGIDAPRRARILDRPRPPATWPAGCADTELLGPDGLTARAQTFTHADVVAAVARTADEGATVAGILDRAAATARRHEVRVVDPGRPGRPARYSTDEVLRCEASVLEAAERGRGGAGHRASPEDVADAVAFPAVPLSYEQARAAEYAAAAVDRIACIVGRAGSGKTTALAAAAQALWAGGIPVSGAAPSAQAAHVLEQATGIPSGTLHALCARWELGVETPSGCIVVDEASMADSRILARLVRQTDRHNVRIVLVGDPQQLPAVGPGGLFLALAERMGAVELAANHRQAAVWERDALEQLRAGDVRVALAAWDDHDRVHRSGDAVGACAAAWWQAAAGADPANTVMLAYRRDEVSALNRAAAARLEAAGRRGPRLGTGVVTYAVGDVVRCRVNDPRHGLRNGMRGRIVAIDRVHGAVTVGDDDGRRVAVPADYLAGGGIEHAWAMTGHAAQGITAEQVFVVAPPRGRHAEWGYVALSRARIATHLFVGGDPTLDGLARSLGARAAQVPATVELAARRRDPPARKAPDGPEPPDPTHHKEALTRGPVLGR